MQKRTISSIDVGRLAGVSHATVSYVLNGRTDKSIPEATRQRVLQAAEELRYRSNRLSHGVLRGKTGLIGVVVPHLVHNYYSHIAQGIMDGCMTAELQPIFVTTHEDIAVEVQRIRRLMEYRVDGLICITYDKGYSRLEHWLEETLSKRIPSVVVDDSSDAGLVDCVVSDDAAGAQQAVAHLLALGHRRIGHLCGGEHTTTGNDRRAGYCRALSAAGMPVIDDLIAGNGYDEAEATAGSITLLDLPDPPTAIFAANDQLAEAVLREAHRRGIRVPEDLALAGYGDLDVGRGMELTTVTQYPHEMGRTVIARLWARMQDPALSPEVLTQPTDLIVRRTSGSFRS